MTTQLNKTPEISAVLHREGFETVLTQLADRLDALANGQPLAAFEIPSASALPKLCRIFGLSTAEAELISLAVGCELSDPLARKVAVINGTGLIDAALAMHLFGNGAWDILCPEAPARRWLLLDLVGSGPLRQRAIQVDERIVQELLGNSYLDRRLSGLIDQMPGDDQVPLSEPLKTAVDTISRAWSHSDRTPLVLLGGADRAAQRRVAAKVATKFNLYPLHLHADGIPADHSQRKTLVTLIDRELALSEAVLVLETTADQAAKAAALADRLTGPTIIIADDPPLAERAPRLRLDLAASSVGARREAWRNALGKRADALGPALDQLASQFSLDPDAIETTVAASADPGLHPDQVASALWGAARIQSRRALNSLAERVESSATWDDLVLPDTLTKSLHQITAQVHHGWQVNQDWGWYRKSPRGLGTTALFAGPSGTGKTLAAEVIANALSLDLYRIDLSQVVSKYIGETEKNLSRIFEAAQQGGAVLLFDEADALFGKRSEVKDSHDRYANVEVSYLLQKMESHSGLAILTTNLKSALDTAFLRRLRYALTFPFPDVATRVRLWQHVFPAQTPLEALDYPALATLSISGGSIRSIALNAAYLAASAHRAVTMADIRSAAFREYAKLEKPVTAIEKGIFR